MKINQIKPGDLVRAKPGLAPLHSTIAEVPWHTGIVIRVEDVEDIFSEKYAIMETETHVHILSDVALLVFALGSDIIEVIK